MEMMLHRHKKKAEDATVSAEQKKAEVKEETTPQQKRTVGRLRRDK